MTRANLYLTYGFSASSYVLLRIVATNALTHHANLVWVQGMTMMTVNELGRQAGVPAHVVRYYTRTGLLRARRDPVNRYRLYRESDVTRLRFIRRAKLLGFTLADIRQILRDAERMQSPCPRARRIIERRLSESEEKLAALVVLQERMKKATKAWRRMQDATPTGESICRLIEGVTRKDALDMSDI